MKSEKKIFLDQQDDLDAAVNRISKTRAHILILNIPRGSVLGKSLDNFHILKRESVTAGKEILVESVDDYILELASLAKIGAVNPVFKQQERIISDILPKPKFKRKKQDTPPLEQVEENVPTRKTEKKPHKKTPFRWRWIVISLFVVLLGGGAFVLVNSILPRATVVMTLKKFPTSFDEQIEISSQAVDTSFSGSSIRLPGELLTARRNLSMRFPASGKEKIERKTKGVLTVYNAYSSEPQVLIATTRFLSPDDKLFRLDERVVVPGAKIIDGKIVPSQIEVLVTADKPGEKYNLEPQSGWRIPGFKGTPRYEGFYADALNPLTGGFIGEEPVPTEEDIESAKDAVITSLKSVLESQMLVLLSNRFKLFDGAREFEVLREEVEPVDEGGNFGIFTEAELRYLVFEEETLKETIAEKAGGSLPPDLRIRDSSFNYRQVEVDLAQGEMSFFVDGTILFEPDIDVENLKSQLFGQNEQELRRIILFLSGLERANISLWPFWVNKVPTNSKRVKIMVE
ncbi:MAG: hypothetical protein KJI72_03440 [Patescibacteria group bacterium]|nr:hypothetical protein [Patescibacteria group bacterium]